MWSCSYCQWYRAVIVVTVTIAVMVIIVGLQQLVMSGIIVGNDVYCCFRVFTLF